MRTTTSRRDFTVAVLTGLGAAVLPTIGSAAARNLKIGCTSLIWGALPRSPDNLGPAVKDMAGLGFHGFETFAAILDEWDKRGTLARSARRQPDPARLRLRDDAGRRSGGAERRTGEAEAVGDGRAPARRPLRRAGAQRRQARGLQLPGAPREYRLGVERYAMAVNDVGLGAGLHQHTGTAVESRDETYAIMEAANTKHLKFAPDVGQLQKGGANAAQVVKDFLPITVHMHLKDFSGGGHFVGYCPLGQGKVDLKAILDMVEAANPNANVMVELDGSANMPYTPRETAQISRTYLEKLGYTFRV